MRIRRQRWFVYALVLAAFSTGVLLLAMNLLSDDGQGPGSVGTAGGSGNGAVLAPGSGEGIVTPRGADALCRRDPAAVPRSPAGPDGKPANYLHTCGSYLYDAHGKRVQITGINWWGMETSAYAPHGLTKRNWKSVLDQVAAMGFNTIRIPFTNEMLLPGARPQGIDYELNPDLKGLNPVQLLDAVVQGARERGLRVILDRHRPESWSQSDLWYTKKVPEAQWIADWRMLARRYLGNDTVIAFDLHNEPKGAATWGTGDPDTDWRLAAERAGNAVLSENAYLLIFVEGVQWYAWDSAWWGGDLREARQAPVRLSLAGRLVYSPHDYGPGVFPQPWFWDPDFPRNLRSFWNGRWGYLQQQGIAPVVVGEFGGRSVGGDREGLWQRELVRYLKEQGIGYLHWSLNPDSVDTGGVLADDWRSVQAARLQLLQSYLAPPLSVGLSGKLGPPPGRWQILLDDQSAATGRQTRFSFRVYNDGPNPVDWSRLKVRYRFAAAGQNGPSDQRAVVEQAPTLGRTADVTLIPVQNNLYEAALTFRTAAGSIKPYALSNEITVVVESSDAHAGSQPPGAVAPAADAFQPSDKISLYLDGKLVWGRPQDEGAKKR